VAERSAPAWVQSGLYGVAGLALLMLKPRKDAAP